MTSTPWNGAWHLRAELARVLDALAGCLQRQRARGRTPAGDPVHGLVIEDGEAEGLVAELRASVQTATTERGPGAPPRRGAREEIADRASQGVRYGASLPLLHASRAFALSDVEYDALLLALAVEVDARFGRLVAYLNDHVQRTRPTVGLAFAVSGDPDDTVAAARFAAEFSDRPIVRDGLLVLEGEGPLPGLALRLPHGVLPRLVGRDSAPLEAGLRLHALDQALLARLVVDTPDCERLTRWGEGRRGRRHEAPLLVEGPPGSGRGTLARAAVFLAGMPVVEVTLGDADPERLHAARREARWHGAALLARASGTLDWKTVWPALAGHVVVLALDAAEGARAAAAAPTEPVVLRVPDPDVPARQALWTALLGEDALPAHDVAALAARFPFGPRRIARAVRRARADTLVRPNGERRLTIGALFDAAREVDATVLGALAQKLALPYTREELVVPPPVNAELELAVAWVRHQHQVLHAWDFRRRVPTGHGLTALFSGPPGTGKTMAAQVIARELGLDVYRVDVSQIMSKYIGETEQHLARLFDARVGILFFDEAEAILGKRSETKDARDRYANIEVGYLLQRMEDYDGVTILATNRMQDIDEAYLRRLHVIVDFPLPSPADRLRIWEGMLPAAAMRAPDLDLRALAYGHEMSGGEIKNAALAAAYMAAAAGEPIGMAQLDRAVRRELRKSGKVVE